MSVSKEELQLITAMLNRPPKALELALFSALWSEHCSYKSSKIHLEKFSKISSKRVVSGPGENAGVVDLGMGEKIAFKIESHNHPSRIVPFHGAATGVGGILRDVFAMNARPIALANYLCFGDIKYPVTKGLLDGVVEGIGAYGNSIGIPMITGQTEFHSSYNENILVNALAVGYYGPFDKIVASKIEEPGAYVLYAGAETGRDGIRGAQMASEALSSESQQSTVQVGDPFYGKLLMEACLEVMGQGWVMAAQDMGAAGLISSSFEMAGKSGLGMNLHLDKTPLRDPTMTMEEILLSESQERMLLVCTPQHYPNIENIFSKWGLPLCILGEVIEERKMNLYWKNKLEVSIDPLLLTNKAPQYNRPHKSWSFPNREKSIASLKQNAKSRGSSFFLKILRQECSREMIYRQYDQRVGAKTAEDCSFPIGIVQLPYTKRFLGLVLGGRPHILGSDAFEGGKDSILHPCLELACRGFEPLAVTDGLNFGNPEKEFVMSQFVACVEGMVEAAQSLSLPVVSGNVSFYNETAQNNIIPTSAIGVIGLRADVAWPQAHFEKNQAVYLIHNRQSYWNDAGKENTLRFFGSVNAGDLNIWIHKIISIARSSIVKSTRVSGKFGLAYALSRMTLKGGVGVCVDQEEEDPFMERFYEVIVCVEEKDSPVFESRLKQLDLQYKKLGKTISDRFVYKGVADLPVHQIQEVYSQAGMSFWKS